jgi:hypothetical protein
MLLLNAPMSFAQEAEPAEEQSPWAFSATAGFFSDYMFRGQKLYEGTSIQPSITGSYDFGDLGSISANVWSHIPAESGPKSDKFTEVDYAVSYSYVMEPVTLTVGHLLYTYPSDNTHALYTRGEIFGTLAVDMPLNPTFTIYEDYDEFDAQYYELILSHTLEFKSLGEGFNMTPSVAFGFGSNA